MTVEVYGDILFLINAGMDALCLLLTAKLLHIPQRMWRWMLASVCGGVYAVAVLWMDVAQPWGFVIDMSVCLLMCGLAFGRRGELGRLCLYAVVYTAISMVMGGVMTALYQMLRRMGVAAWLPGGDDGISSLAFVLLAGLGGIFTHIWGRFFKKQQRTKSCVLTITMGERQVTLSAMVDSGNLLQDPMGGGLVIPVKTQATLPLLSPRLQDLLTRQEKFDDALWEIPEASRIRLIPTGTAMGQGILVALRPDIILLTPEGESPYAVKALIAPTPLPEAPADALIPLDLLT